MEDRMNLVIRPQQIGHSICQRNRNTLECLKAVSVTIGELRCPAQCITRIIVIVYVNLSKIQK